MPKSRFVEARRLRPLIAYLAVSVVVVLVTDAVLRAVAPGGTGRQLLVFAWLVLFPLGGWIVWRRGATGP